jgi:hypothetical protein
MSLSIKLKLDTYIKIGEVAQGSVAVARCTSIVDGGPLEEKLEKKKKNTTCSISGVAAVQTPCKNGVFSKSQILWRRRMLPTNDCHHHSPNHPDYTVTNLQTQTTTKEEQSN